MLKIVAKIVASIVLFGMPSVYYYHLFTENVFLNVAACDAKGLEKLGNILLTPNRYLFAGKRANVIDEENHIYFLRQEYTYLDKSMWPKTAEAIVAYPFALTMGAAVKSLAFLSHDTKERHKWLTRAAKSATVISNIPFYEKIGLQIELPSKMLWASPPQYARRPGDEKKMETAKQALREISRILQKYDIPYWLDCGTCLGAYRYGGPIPWDNDIDIAILETDFTNVKNVLRYLDPKKYVVQDWSSRDKPGTLLKVYIRESKELIDIYHYAIDTEKKNLYTIISNIDCIFLPDRWRIRERYCATPVPFDVIFPLKKVLFDGIEVFVPGQTEKFLQSKYGENISPAKIYNENTGEYEKDLSHPYWEFKHVH